MGKKQNVRNGDKERESRKSSDKEDNSLSCDGMAV